MTLDHLPDETIPKKGPRFQLSLRTFLIVIFVCCILFAIFAEGYWRRSRLKGHLDAIAQSGAVHNLMINRNDWNASNIDNFYSRFFSLPVNMGDAAYVYTSDGAERFDDETLAHALALPKLSVLELWGECSVTDNGLATISDVNPPYLHRIDLRGTKTTDAGFLSLVDVENLTDIWIGDQTKITDKGIETFRELRGPYLQLPEVRVHRSGISSDWRQPIESLLADLRHAPEDRRMSEEKSRLLQYLEELGISENLKDLAIRFQQREKRSKRSTHLIDFLFDYQPLFFYAAPLLICTLLWLVVPKLNKRSN